MDVNNRIALVLGQKDIMIATLEATVEALKKEIDELKSKMDSK